MSETAAPDTLATPEKPEEQKTDFQLDPEKVKRLEAEYQQLLEKLQEYEKKIKAYEDEKLSESEKLSKRLAEVEAERQEVAAELQAARLQLAVQREAHALGVDPELAYRLINPADVEFDKRGIPQNVGKLLRSLLERYPQLAGGGVSPANVGRAAAPGVIRASQLRDRRFWEQNKEAIFKAIAEGRFIVDE